MHDLFTSPSLRAQLRDATEAIHAHLEARLPAFDAHLSRSHYVALLEAYAGFMIPVEQQVSRLLMAEGALFAEPCRRAIWLQRDLRLLTREGAPPRPIPVCPRLPRISTGAEAWGGAYVLEGSTLGGRVIGGRLRACLGIDAKGGGAFFHGHGEATGRHWKQFVGALDAAGASGRVAWEEATRAAVETFSCLMLWLAEQKILRW